MKRQGFEEQQIEEAKKKNKREDDKEELKEMTADELGDLSDLLVTKEGKKGKNKK